MAAISNLHSNTGMLFQWWTSMMMSICRWNSAQVVDRWSTLNHNTRIHASGGWEGEATRIEASTTSRKNRPFCAYLDHNDFIVVWPMRTIHLHTIKLLKLGIRVDSQHPILGRHIAHVSGRIEITSHSCLGVVCPSCFGGTGRGWR